MSRETIGVLQKRTGGEWNTVLEQFFSFLSGDSVAFCEMAQEYPFSNVFTDADEEYKRGCFYHISVKDFLSHDFCPHTTGITILDHMNLPVRILKELKVTNIGPKAKKDCDNLEKRVDRIKVELVLSADEGFIPESRERVIEVLMAAQIAVPYILEYGEDYRIVVGFS